MEQYLKDQYNVYEDLKWLKDETQIVETFKDIGADYLDCGIGYSQEDAEVICYINGKFYKVLIEAEIASSKQDRGDRLYWVDYITNVTYEEIDKPKRKDDSLIVMRIEAYKKQAVTNLLNSEGINFSFDE